MLTTPGSRSAYLWAQGPPPGLPPCSHLFPNLNPFCYSGFLDGSCANHCATSTVFILELSLSRGSPAFCSESQVAAHALSAVPL